MVKYINMADEEIKIDEEDELGEFEMDLNGPTDYISAAYFAMSAVDDVDIEIMPDAMKARIRRIRAKSIRIIDHSISELYSDLFDEDV